MRKKAGMRAEAPSEAAINHVIAARAYPLEPSSVWEGEAVLANDLG